MSENKAKNLTKDATVTPVNFSEKELAKQRWHDLFQEEKKMVRGKFIDHECPGGSVDFSYRKYKETPLTNYSMKDGEIYEVPLYIARHLNNNCSFPTYVFKNDEAGRPVTTISERVHRYAFQSLDFL